MDLNKEFANDAAQPEHSGSGFWTSRAGLVFFAFFGLAGFLLGYEHRAHILTGNGFLIALLLLCPAMHLFMHRGHGGHRP